MKIASLSSTTALVSLSLALAGCGTVGGTTYGTGVTQEEQLLEDLSGAITLGSRKKKPRINYGERPDLVKPPSRQVLPRPQEQIAVANNPNWPQDPEQRRREFRAAADKAADGEYKLTPEEEAERRRLVLSRKDYLAQKRTRIRREIKQANLGVDAKGAPKRRFLTEPPTDYRKPVATAPIGEVGIPEDKKKVKKQGPSFWSRINPFD